MEHYDRVDDETALEEEEGEEQEAFEEEGDEESEEEDEDEWLHHEASEAQEDWFDEEFETGRVDDEEDESEGGGYDEDDLDSEEDEQDAPHDLALLRAYFRGGAAAGMLASHQALRRDTTSHTETEAVSSPPESWYFRIHHWTEDDLREMLQKAQQDYRTNSVCIDANNLDDWDAASRTAEMVSRFPRLSHLELKRFDYNDDGGEESAFLHLQYTDHVLRVLADASSHAAIRSVLLWGFDDSTAYTDFVTRYSGTLESLNLGDQDGKRPMQMMDPSVAQTVSSSFRCMGHLRHLTLCLAPAADQSELWAGVFSGLASAPQLEQISVFLEPSRSKSARAIHNVVHGLACALPHCQSLRHLLLDASSMQHRVDATCVLQLAAYSNSLQELEFKHVTLQNQATEWHGGGRDSVNVSLRTLNFTSFTILGSDEMDLLAPYKNLSSVRFVICAEDPNAVDLHRAANSWESFLRHHPHLELLEYSSGYDKVGAKCIDSDAVLATVVRGITSRPPFSPLLRELSLDVEGETEFPSLVPLLQVCRGSIKLFLSGHSELNIPFLAQGLAATNPELHQVCIVMCNLSLDKLAILLRALKVNRTLKTFYLYAYYVDNNDPTGTIVDPALEELLVENASLTCFALQLIHVSPNDNVSRRLLERAALGLRNNRTLQKLRWTYGTRLDTLGASHLHALLRTNTTLREIKGVEYADRRDKGVIEQTLVLNKYGRYLLLHPTVSTVPPGLWPKAVAKMVSDQQPDPLLQFLRHLPRSVVRQRGIQRAAAIRQHTEEDEAEFPHSGPIRRRRSPDPEVPTQTTTSPMLVDN